MLLAAIFLIACLNTCIGLISCVSEYFHGLFPRIPYVGFAAFFALASMVVSNIGLAGIIRLSTPVLNAIYPAAIVLIALSFVPRLETYRWVYPMAVGFTCVQSVVAALAQSGLRLPVITALLEKLPLAALGFGWIAPALAGLAVGLFLSRRTQKLEKAK